MFEIVNTRKANFSLEQLLEIQTNINKHTNDISVRDLQVVPKLV